MFKCNFCKKTSEIEEVIHGHMLIVHGFYLQTCSVRFGKSAQRIEELRETWKKLNHNILERKKVIKGYDRNYKKLLCEGKEVEAHKRLIKRNNLYNKLESIERTFDILSNTIRKEGIVII